MTVMSKPTPEPRVKNMAWIIPAGRISNWREVEGGNPERWRKTWRARRRISPRHPSRFLCGPAARASLGVWVDARMLSSKSLFMDLAAGPAFDYPRGEVDDKAESNSSARPWCFLSIEGGHRHVAHSAYSTRRSIADSYQTSLCVIYVVLMAPHLRAKLTPVQTIPRNSQARPRIIARKDMLKRSGTSLRLARVACRPAVYHLLRPHHADRRGLGLEVSMPEVQE